MAAGKYADAGHKSWVGILWQTQLKLIKGSSQVVKNVDFSQTHQIEPSAWVITNQEVRLAQVLSFQSLVSTKISKILFLRKSQEYR